MSAEISVPAKADGASALRLSMALEAGHIGTWHWDLRTGVVERDAAMARLLGSEPGELAPTMDGYLEMVHVEDRASLAAQFAEVLATGTETFSNVHRVVLPVVGERWLETHGQATFAPDGQPLEVVGVIIDITERRRDEFQHAISRKSEADALRRATAAQRRMQMQAAAADLLDAPLELDGALQQVADLMTEVLADWCSVEIVTERRIHHAAVAHRDPEMAATARRLKERYPQDLDEPVFKHLMKSLEPIFVREFEDRILDETLPDEEHRDALRKFHISSYLVVPLVARGVGIGIITLASCHGRQLSAGDVEIAADLGRRAGAAVEKTRLYAQLEETSRVLQTSLLPAALPSVPGIALSAHYSSGTDGLSIGGDFYDVFTTGRNRWWIVLGDVCGKGPAAAALTAALRYSLRSVVPDQHDPGVVLARLNDALNEQDWQGRFASAVLLTFVAGQATVDEGQAENRNLTLTIATAGHPPPLVRATDGTVSPIETAGTLLGVVPDIHAASVTLHLSAGETLLLYTDGATEARDFLWRRARPGRPRRHPVCRSRPPRNADLRSAGQRPAEPHRWQPARRPRVPHPGSRQLIPAAIAQATEPAVVLCFSSAVDAERATGADLRCREPTRCAGVPRVGPSRRPGPGRHPPHASSTGTSPRTR